MSLFSSAIALERGATLANMGTTRVFLPQGSLDAWLAAGSVRLNDGHLCTLDDRRVYRLVEAVRIVDEVSGSADSFELVGKVKPLGHVQQLGAELLGDSMLLEDNAYDIVLGWVAIPEHRRAAMLAAGVDGGPDGVAGPDAAPGFDGVPAPSAAPARGRGQEFDNAQARLQSDAEALAQFLAKNL